MICVPVRRDEVMSETVWPTCNVPEATEDTFRTVLAEVTVQEPSVPPADS